jgi:hypothetical protein
VQPENQRQLGSNKAGQKRRESRISSAR